MNKIFLLNNPETFANFANTLAQHQQLSNIVTPYHTTAPLNQPSLYSLIQPREQFNTQEVKYWIHYNQFKNLFNIKLSNQKWLFHSIIIPLYNLINHNKKSNHKLTLNNKSTTTSSPTTRNPTTKRRRTPKFWRLYFKWNW